MADGSRHTLYASEETVYGTTDTNPALSTVRVTGTTLGLAKDSLQSAEIRSDRMISDFRLGANRVAGDINFELSYGSFDQFLEAGLLSADWAVDTPITDTDQLKAGTTRRSFSFVRYFADVLTADNPYHIFTGCEITGLQLTLSANAMITGVMNVVGSGLTLAQNLTGLGTPTFPAVSTTTPLDAFTGTITEGGSSIAVVTELTLNLQNGIEPRYVIGSNNSIFPSVARSNLTGQVTAYFEDSDLLSKFINETESAIIFTLPDAAGNSYQVEIPRIKYTGGQPDVGGEGPVLITLPFQALRDTTESTNIVIERTDA